MWKPLCLHSITRLCFPFWRKAVVRKWTYRPRKWRTKCIRVLYERAIHGHGGVECEEIFAVFFAELEAPGPNIFGWRQTCNITNETESRSRRKQDSAPQYWNYDTFFRETQTQKYCRKLSQFSWIYGWVRLRAINLSRNCLLSKKSIAMWDLTQYRCLLIVEILNIFFARVPCAIPIQCR